MITLSTAQRRQLDADTTLPVSEVFGPTIQGEGPFAGRACQFLRTGGCNLSCGWCDTPYTWDGTRFDLRKEIKPMAGRDILASLIDGVPLVLSGGEPLLHQDNGGLLYVLRNARYCEIPIHVETNGTIAPSRKIRHLIDVFIVSPKMEHAGSHRGRQDPALHDDWAPFARKHPHVYLKVVVQHALDVEHVVRWAKDVGWPRDKVWVMPLGTTSEDLLFHWEDIAAAAAEGKINASQRLHVLAWGDRKGT